jgi:myo-inositol 2-dehydrogenase / D-chiro-inositol 1-dehydrogenase
MAQMRAYDLILNDRVDWVGIGSDNRERAAAAALASGASMSGSVGDVLSADIDAVVIAGSSGDHAAQIIRAIDYRVPILCEKPIATAFTDAVRVSKAAQDARVELMIGFQRRFDVAFAATRERIRSGDLGTLYLLRLLAHDRVPPSPAFEKGSGGIVQDLMVHDFDLVRWLTDDEISSVYAIGSNRTDLAYIEEAGDFDVVGAVLEMNSGLVVLLSAARHSPGGHDVRAEIFGSAETLGVGFERDRSALSDIVDGSTIARAPDPFEDFMQRFRPAFALQTRAFVEMVAGERRNPSPAADGIAAQQAAAAALVSIAENRAVAMTEMAARF